MNKIEAYLVGEVVLSVNSDAFSLYEKSHFGEQKGEKIQYSLTEAMFLVEREKMEIFSKNKKLNQKEFVEKCRKIDKKIQIKYPVFKDLRERGYVVKTALKFGADFRVYDKGIKPGEDHAKWIVYPVAEADTLTWYEFSAKNRVAHSTKKRLLIAVLDAENDITYWEIKWTRP